MGASELDLVRGTVDVLILKVLTWGPQHGFGVAKWIRQATDGELLVEDSSLYPALHRMEEREWIAAEWDLTENGRRAKFYKLTALGRQELRRQTATWTRYSKAVTKVIELASQPV
jgi:transcriptional regulator